jgi:hypothetical protein
VPNPDLRFVWDARKAQTNLAKHGITFREATQAFRDNHGVLRHDPLHSTDEDRWILIGVAFRERLLVVVFTEDGDKIRIISARRATRREQDDYEESFQQGAP